MDFHPEAREDLSAAANYYNDAAAPTGEAFLAEMDEAIDYITSYPLAAPTVHRYLRQKCLNRFRYNIIYDVRPEGIFIVAVAHHSRRPYYWLERLQS